MVTVKQQSGVTVLIPSGALDAEKLDALMQASQESPKLVFNLRHVEMHGSSHLAGFIQMVKDLYSRPEQPRFCEVNQDIRKVLRVYSKGVNLFIFPSEDEALQSFQA